MKKIELPLVVKYRGKRLGTGKVFFKRGDKRPASTHLFCDKCGELWGSVLVEDSILTEHQVKYVRCTEHGGGMFSQKKSNLSSYEVVFDSEVSLHDIERALAFTEIPEIKINGAPNQKEGGSLPVGSDDYIFCWDAISEA